MSLSTRQAMSFWDIPEGASGLKCLMFRYLSIPQRVHVSCSLNSLNGGYIRDYIEDYYRGC